MTTPTIDAAPKGGYLDRTETNIAVDRVCNFRLGTAGVEPG